MCAYRPRGGGPGEYRSYPPRPRDDFYDDRVSRSRSPPRQNSSPRRRSPHYDSQRGNARRFGGDGQYSRDVRDGPQHDYRGRSRDRRDIDRRSRSPRRDYDNHSRSRSYSRSRSHSPNARDGRPPSRGQPSKEIMLEGLSPHLTENDITNELRQHYHVQALDDVRIIRDRQTKQSRQFGFLRFPTLDDAEAFMDANYPTIYLYGNSDATHSSEKFKVRIAYGKERKEPRIEEGDWMCRICNINNYSTRARCFRCQTLRPEPSSLQKVANNGDNDAAPDNTPSQFLLFRGLEPSVSEELFAKGVAKLNKPTGNQAQQIQSQAKKGAKVASTTGDANLGAREGTLRRVLLIRDRRTDESWRYGFAEFASIDDAQAALTRYNSFDRFTIASRQVIVSYIHAGVFVPVLAPNSVDERFTFSPLGNSAMRLAYWDEEAYVAEHVVSAQDSETKQGKQPGTQNESEALKSIKESDKTKKRKAQEGTQAAAKKPAPSHLQFWSNRHAELHGIKKGSKSSESENGDMSAPPLKSYANPEKNCCYLCMRQFNSPAEVNKHERLSGLHRQNMKDENRIKRAEHKLEKHGVQSETTASAIEYRDRARERRKIYGVVNKKGEQVGGNTNSSKPSLDDDEDNNKPSAQQSKGAALLSKMGYTAGQGLGASGEGMTAPLSQDIYMAGVGLGAQGGKVGDAVAEAERNTKGDYSAFAEQTRDRARERYNQMGR